MAVNDGPRYTQKERRAKLLEQAGQFEAVSDAPPSNAGLAAIDPGEKYVEVEWLGERSFIEDPRVAYKLMRVGKADGFTPHQAKVIRTAAQMRIGRFKNHNREMGRESGLSRQYIWGPKAGTYVRRMTLADAEKLKATNSGHEFKIRGEKADEPLILPNTHVRLMGAKEFSRIETVAGLGG